MADGINKSLSETQKVADAATSSLNEMTNAMLKTGKGFDAILAGADGMASGIGSAGRAIDGIVGSVPGLGKVGELINNVAGVFEGVATAATKVGKVYGTVIKGLDGFSQPTRALQKDMYELSAQFGGTFEAGQDMANFMLDYADKVSTKDFGYINLRETKEAAEGFKQAKVPIENFYKTIESSAGSMRLLDIGVLHSQALHIDTTKYFNLMGNAILKQGLSAQDAAEQMAMFGDMAEVTGLSVDTIADSLHGLTSKFTKLGLTADFGRPLLEGFARTLSGMGLGIENSTALAEGLGEALAGLTENYSMAYVVAQRGGLEFGAGGGALGGSIGLQAKMLEAEKTGDQAGLGLEMADAMKETLESFTGGAIVTVQEAAESPELQQTFYTQQKLLEQMFSLDGKTATRTLDYLSQLDEVTASGNTDLMNSLGEQIDETINARDETLDEMDKLNATSNAQLAQLQVQSATLFGIMRATAGDMRELPEGLLESAVAAAAEKTAGAEENMRGVQDIVNTLIDKTGFRSGSEDKEVTGRFKATPNYGEGSTSVDDDLKKGMTNLIGRVDELIRSTTKLREEGRGWGGMQ